MYKTILMHIDTSSAALSRLEAAARLALAHDARLVGLAVTGRLQGDYLGNGLTPGVVLPVIDYGPARELAQQQLAAFDQAAERLGVGARECRLADTTAELALSLHSRYADLVVVSQGAMTSTNPFISTRLAGYLAVQGASPVLVVPHSGRQASLGKSIVIGWNGSREGRHAIDAAMPLLRAAGQVRLAIFNPGNYGPAHGQDPGADMAAMLARRGVKVDVVVRPTMDEPGQALQDLAGQTGADLIVAGAYGHSRLQEWFMGGSTRTLLEDMQVPVLLAH
jgi:nucleotide-binding universal stress UspA family protein